MLHERPITTKNQSQRTKVFSSSTSNLNFQKKKTKKIIAWSNKQKVNDLKPRKLRKEEKKKTAGLC